MSATTVTTAPVTGIVATSATDAPFTVTATITATSAGRRYLALMVDGEMHCYAIDRNLLKLHAVTVEDEGTRLLQRHAAMQPATAWTETAAGELRADVVEVPGRCTTCAHGCFCEPGSGGCGHYGCWTATDANADTCDGARIHLEARRPKRLARRGGRR